MLRPFAKTTVFLICIMKSVHLYGVSTTGKCENYVIGVADLIGILIVRHGYACCAKRGVCVWPKAGRSIFLTSSSEVSFEVLFLLRSAGRLHALNL